MRQSNCRNCMSLIAGSFFLNFLLVKSLIPVIDVGLNRAAGRTIGAKSIANAPRVYLCCKSNGWDAKSWRPFSFYKKEVSHRSATCIPATLSSKTVSPGTIDTTLITYVTLHHTYQQTIHPSQMGGCVRTSVPCNF
jgi:hypothetical protein